MPTGRIRGGRPERQHHNASRARRGLVAATVGLALGAIGAQPARAGEYVMRNCDVPGYGSAPLGPWAFVIRPLDTVTSVDACPTGGGASFVMRSGSIAGDTGRAISLEKPAAMRNQITIVRATLWYAARFQGSGGPLYLTAWAALTNNAERLLLENGPPGSENQSAEVQLGADVTRVSFILECGRYDDTSATPADCVPSSNVPLLVRGIETTLSEDAPPIVRQPVGTLLDGKPQSGVKTLSYSASDAQSGLASVDVMLDGTAVGGSDLTPRCPYSDFTVCPASQDETLQIDTRAVANGSHRLTLRVRDAAGNERVVNVADAIKVANAPEAGTSDASADVSAYALTAQFDGTSRSSVTVPYGRRVSIRGRITRGGESGSAGTQIEVLKKLDRRGAREVSAGHVVTGADGSFSLALPTTRPSRTVRLVYRPSGGSAVASAALKLRVRAASRLSASLRGRVVRFSGTVLSGPIAKGGKRVEMEGRSPGSAWTRFKNVRTDSKGRFSGTYRLRVRRPGVVLKIRALVPSEAGYGYLGSRSPAVTMRVR